MYRECCIRAELTAVLGNSVIASVLLIKDTMNFSVAHEPPLLSAGLVRGSGHGAKNRTKLLSMCHFPLAGLRETMYRITK